MTKVRKEIDIKMVNIINKIQREKNKTSKKYITFPKASKLLANKISGGFLK